MDAIAKSEQSCSHGLKRKSPVELVLITPKRIRLSNSQQDKIQPCNCSHRIDKSRKTGSSSIQPEHCINSLRVSEMLRQSLAVALVRVAMDSGEGTAEKIIEVLQDESFDLKDFQQHVTSLKNCEDITRSVAGSE